METNNVNNPEFNSYVERPMLGFGEAVKICFNKYFDFTGRARRSEYWWFVLFQILVSIPCAILDGFLEAAASISFVNAIASLVFFFPALTVSFRRLHDIGRSGWWIGTSYILVAIGIIAMIATVGTSGLSLSDNEAIANYLLSVKSLGAWLPIIASCVICIIVFIFSLLDSHKEENKYGPSPKYM